MSDVANMDVVGETTLNSDTDMPLEVETPSESGAEGEGFGET